MTTTSPHKIAQAVKYTSFARKNPNSADDVNFYLADNEKITQADLTNFHAAVAQHGLPKAADLLDVAKEEPEEWLEPAAQEPASTGANEPVEEAAPVDTAAPADEIAQEAPEAEAPTLSITEAKSKLLESQILFRSATDAQRICRARLGRAIAGWQAALGVIVTAEQNARAHIASENEQRAMRAAGLLPARGSRARPGPSAIDQMASATAGGSFRAGGGFAFKRGLIDGGAPGVRAMPLAQSQTMLTRIEAARMETARKALPSER